MSIDPGERRGAIISAVVAQITATGSPDVVMADVVRASGSALKTVYRAFGSKQLLLAEAVLVWHREVVGRATALQPAPAVGDRVLQFLESCLVDFARDRGMARLLVRYFATTDPHVVAALTAMQEGTDGALHAFLAADAPTVTLTTALTTYGLTLIAAGHRDPQIVIDQVCAAARVSLPMN